jgi:hypothetical protein
MLVWEQCAAFNLCNRLQITLIALVWEQRAAFNLCNLWTYPQITQITLVWEQRVKS